jgi:hypothetical protein
LQKSIDSENQDRIRSRTVAVAVASLCFSGFTKVIFAYTGPVPQSALNTVDRVVCLKEA